jgi:hypothetical protein
MEMVIIVDSPDDEQVPRMMTRYMDRNRLKMSYYNLGILSVPGERILK